MCLAIENYFGQKREAANDWLQQYFTSGGTST
jgi:hypothetical protein